MQRCAQRMMKLGDSSMMYFAMSPCCALLGCCFGSCSLLRDARPTALCQFLAQSCMGGVCRSSEKSRNSTMTGGKSGRRPPCMQFD